MVSEAVKKKREAGAKALIDAGIPFERVNDGAYLVIRRAGRTIDFWPGTGVWQDRRDATEKSGVKSLVKLVKTAEAAQARLKKILDRSP